MSNTGLENELQASEQLFIDIANLKADAGKSVEDAFNNIDKFLQDYTSRTGDTGPINRWINYRMAWTKLAKDPKVLAQQIISNYTDYDTMLTKIQNVSTEEEVKKAIADLENLRASRPTDISLKTAYSFEYLMKDVAGFRNDYDFPDVKPDCDLICNTMQEFSTLWKGFNAASLKFKELLDALKSITSPQDFKTHIKVAKEVVTPLLEGLKKYLAS